MKIYFWYGLGVDSEVGLILVIGGKKGMMQFATESQLISSFKTYSNGHYAK